MHFTTAVLQAELEVLPSRLQLVAVTGPGQGRAGLLSTLAATHSTILDIEYLAASSTTQVWCTAVGVTYTATIAVCFETNLSPISIILGVQHISVTMCQQIHETQHSQSPSRNSI